MHYISPIFFILFLTYFQKINLSFANDYLHYTCGSSGNDTEISVYKTDLEKLFTSLSTEAVASEGFTTNTISVPDQISGLVLCRGDVNSSICSSCLIQSIIDIQTICPNSKEATIWYDLCLLRYSNNDLFSSTDNSEQVINVTSKRFSGWNPPNAIAKTYFKTMMEGLLSSVAYQAAYSSAKRFAVGDINTTSSGPTIYSMSQCTPDLPSDACHSCLQDLINQMLNNFDGRQGGRILGVRCSLRYEVYKFYSDFQQVLPLSSSSGPVKQIAPGDAVSGKQPTPAPLVSPWPHNLTTPAPLTATPPSSLATVPQSTNKD